MNDQTDRYFDNGSDTKEFDMQKMIFGTLSLLFSFSAMASESYRCTAHFPKGNASMSIQAEPDGSQTIRFAFFNQAKNQIYPGTLQVLENSSNEILAEGNLRAFDADPVISVSLVGSLTPDESGTVSLQIYAQGDKRIERGFGNILHCQKN